MVFVFVIYQPDSPSKSLPATPVKPLSHRERCFVQRHAIFLLRNLTKVRQVRCKSQPCTPSCEVKPFLARTDPPAEQGEHHHHMAFITPTVVSFFNKNCVENLLSFSLLLYNFNLWIFLKN